MLERSWKNCWIFSSTTYNCFYKKRSSRNSKDLCLYYLILADASVVQFFNFDLVVGLVICSILIVKSSKQLEVYSINSPQNVSTPSLPKFLSSRLFFLFWLSPSNFTINNLGQLKMCLRFKQGHTLTLN